MEFTTGVVYCSESILNHDFLRLMCLLPLTQTKGKFINVSDQEINNLTEQREKMQSVFIIKVKVVFKV